MTPGWGEYSLITMPNFKKIVRSLFILALVTSWLLTSMPRLWFINFPPKIKEVRAIELIIEAGDTTQSGNNSTLTSHNISIPSYVEGDLIIINIGYWQDNNQTNDSTFPAGPNGETITVIDTNYGPAQGNYDVPLIALGWFIGTGTYGGGTISQSFTIGSRHDSAVIKVLDGEFDPTTPISAQYGQDYSSANSTTPGFPGFTAASADIDGKLMAFIAVDQDPISGTPTGYTDFIDHDQGRMSIVLSGRDSAVTSSESIDAENWTIGSDAYTGWAYIVRTSDANAPPNTPTLDNAPFDNERVYDTTPAFEFTGSDPDGTADITYHIQIDDDQQFGSVIVECESDTSCATGDGGWDAGGDTSDPFGEGVQMVFTPTTTLASGTTYWWRVRAEDVVGGGGSGTYGNWTTAISFTPDSGSMPYSEWFQTVDEQFNTDDLSFTKVSGSDSVEIAEAFNTPAFETGEEIFDDSLDWTSITFSSSYSSTPVVIVTPVTANNCEAVGTCAGNSTSVDTGGMYPIALVRNVSTTGFDLAMCVDGGSETCDVDPGVSSETFHWFAFDSDDDDSYDWIEVGTTASVSVDGTATAETYSTSFASTPDVWTQAQTYSQGDQIGAHAWVTPKSTSGFSYVGCVMSPIANDTCDDGTAVDETFGYVAIDVSNEVFENGTIFQSSSASISNSIWTAASFSPTYTSPRVMVTQNTESGSQDGQYAWARSVTSLGMDFRYCEQDGGTTCNTHNAETVHWFAVEQSPAGNSGTIQSSQVDFDWFTDSPPDWNEVTVGADTTNGSITIDILDENEVDTGLGCVITGSSCTINISSLDPAVDDTQIYILATLNDSGGTPYLEYWTVTLGNGSSTTFTQNTYRWYVDNDGTNPTEVWGIPDLAENTAIVVIPSVNDPPNNSQELRLRLNMTVNAAALSATSQQFKLQFKSGTDGSCTTGSWADVAGSATWEYATSSVSDGALITGVLSTSDVNGQYAKSSPTTTNTNSATVGQDIEYDFHIVGTNIAEATQYSFRVLESDATVFDAYTNCPTLTTEPGMFNLMRHGNLFSDDVELGFYWAN